MSYRDMLKTLTSVVEGYQQRKHPMVESCIESAHKVLSAPPTNPADILAEIEKLVSKKKKLKKARKKQGSEEQIYDKIIELIWAERSRRGANHSTNGMVEVIRQIEALRDAKKSYEPG